MQLPTEVGGDDIQLEAFREALGEILAEEQTTWQRERALIEAQAGRTVAELRAEVLAFRSELTSRFNDTINQLQNEFASRLRELRDGRDGEPGVQGPIGPAGERGAQGERGVQGEAGDPGDPGPQGERGERGETGARGEPGSTGEPGPAGERGERGEVGEKGEIGSSGPVGERGEMGPPGDRGERGEKGERGDGGEPGIQGLQGERGIEGARGEPGARGDTGEPGPAGGPGEKGERGDAGPEGPIGEVGPSGAMGLKGERGEPGPEGRLPLVKEFVLGKVHYAGAVVTYEGSLWQAKCDTGQTPPDEDWMALAKRGLDGIDGITFNVRGTWKAEEVYSRLDVVAVDGSAFVARKDKPGVCPGADWQLIASHGRQGIKGPQGHKGERGEQGEPGATLVAWKIDRKNYTITPVMSDGTQPASLNLRELFEQFNSEAN